MSSQLNTYALVSLEEVKQFYDRGDKSKAADDGLLTELINRVSTLVENYIGYNILTREYTEYFDGGGRNFLHPKHEPITVVSGVWDDGQWGWGSSTEIDSSNYRIHNDENAIIFKNITFNRYRQSVKLIYTAGVTATPDDLKHIVVTEVVRAHKNRGKVDVDSKTMRDGSIAYTAKDFLPTTMRVLNEYRKSVAV